VRGTYEQVAERLIHVMDQVGGDGYAVRANYLSDSLAGYVVEFVDHVVPILQREGYAKTCNPPGTLRERLRAYH
jgi:long-chain alkane monooxygenase